MFDTLLKTLKRPSLSPPPTEEAPRWPVYAFGLLAVIVAAGLYAHTLNLPFFEDDPVHIRWLSEHGLFDSWLTAENLPDYRPLGRFIMQVWAYALGWHKPILLRVHNVLLHALNAVLVAALVLRLNRGQSRYAAAGLAAFFFAAYPFAYQAVPWINVLFYPLVTFLLLALALIYTLARERGSGRLLAATIFLAALAPFEIEHAVMAFAVLGAMEVIWWRVGWQRWPWLLPALIVFALNVTFVIIWITRPRFAYAFGLPTVERVYQIGFYLLQGFAWPVMPAAQPIMGATPLDDLGAIFIVGVPAVLGAIWVLRRERALLGIGLAWFGVLAVPSLLYLTFDYVINSPRLLYPLAPGAAMIWGAAVAALLVGRIWQRQIAALLTGSILMGGIFAFQQASFYGIGAAPIAQMDAAAAETPDDARMLIVNAPAWVSPPKETQLYALGNYGAQVFPFWLSARDMIFAQRGEDQAAEAVAFANVIAETWYHKGIAGSEGPDGRWLHWDDLRAEMVSAPGGVYVTQYADVAIDLVYAGEVRAYPLDAEILATFGEEGALHIRLDWAVSPPYAHDHTVFVHLIGPDGPVIAQADGYPLRGLAPFWLWEEPRAVHDARVIVWPDDAPTAAYMIKVGVYNPANGERARAYDMKGEEMADSAFTIWRNVGP